MPDYIGPAIRGLSETVYRGFSDIGQGRITEATLALKKAEIEDKIAQRREEAPLRAFKILEATKKAKEYQEQYSPFNVSGWVNEQLGKGGDPNNDPLGVGGPVRVDEKMWMAQLIPKLATVFGDDVKYDPTKKQFIRQSNGFPITNKEVKDREQAIAGMVSVHTDGDKYLEMLAKQGNPEALKQVAERDKNPIGYLNYQLEQKRKIMESLAGLNLPDAALKNLQEGYKYTLTKLEKLEGEARGETRALQREARTEDRTMAREGRTEERAIEREKRQNELLKHENKMFLVATSIGMSPEKIRKGDISKEEATKLLDAYEKRFGKDALLDMLLKGSVGSTEGLVKPGGKIKYDSSGNMVNE